MSEPTQVRYTDLFCEGCQSDILANGCMLDLGLVTSGLLSFVDLVDCSDCRAAVAVLGATGWRVSGLPDLTSVEEEDLTAFHEAGHVALALVTGQPVRGVGFRPTGHGSHAQTFLARPPRVSLEDQAAIAWAGQLAGLRRLADHPFDTTANRLDLRLIGTDDIQLTLDAIRDAGRVGEAQAILARGREYADIVLDARWEDLVVPIQDDLRRHRALKFEGDRWMPLLDGGVLPAPEVA